MCRCIRRACTVGHEDAWSGSISTINNKQILCSTSQCVSRARKNYGRWNAASHICQHLILRDMRRLVTHPQCTSIIYFMKRNRYQHEIAKTCYQPLSSLLPGHCINGSLGVSMTPYDWRQGPSCLELWAWIRILSMHLMQVRNIFEWMLLFYATLDKRNEFVYRLINGVQLLTLMYLYLYKYLIRMIFAHTAICIQDYVPGVPGTSHGRD